MNNDILVIKQNPRSASVAFFVESHVSLMTAQTVFNLVRKRLDMG